MRGPQGQQTEPRQRCAGFTLAFGLQHRPRHLLDEQRNAVGALDDVLPDIRGQQLVADDAVDHDADFALPQPVDGEECHVRAADPRRLELRPEGHDQQTREGS